MGNIVRKFWRLMCLICCVMALAFVILDDPTGAIVTVLSGIGFFAISAWPHTGLDAL